MPESASQGGVYSRGCLLRGGCLIRGWAGGSAPGGVCLGGVCSGGWYSSMHWGRHPPCKQNDKQAQKYYLGHNFVAASHNAFCNDTTRWLMQMHWRPSHFLRRVDAGPELQSSGQRYLTDRRIDLDFSNVISSVNPASLKLRTAGMSVSFEN